MKNSNENLNEYTLVGAITLSNDGKTTQYPADLRLIFKKGNDYFEQMSDKGPLPFSYKESSSFFPLNLKAFLTSKNFYFLRLNENDFGNLDKSKKIYGYALGNNQVIVENLFEFSRQLNNVSIQNKKISSTQQWFNLLVKQTLKNGFTCTDSIFMETDGMSK